ncbi:MAG: PH domain-containing protein [bacterium]|nr:PH domain-containing protein [bacterium]
MVTQQEVDRQLRAIGSKPSWWGRAEMRELKHILIPDENIQYAINGRYEGGFAMLAVTDQRILLIDKKPFYLTLEDIRYDMVSEVDYNQRLIDSSIVICTVNKKLRFTVFRTGKIRQATYYIQGRVMEFRHQPTSQYQSFGMNIPMHNLNQSVSVSAPQGVYGMQARIAPPLQNQPYELAGETPQIHGVANSIDQKVRPIVHRITNPYTRVPLMMRRRDNRYFG